MTPDKISANTTRILEGGTLNKHLTAVEQIAVLRTAANAIENSLQAESMYAVIRNVLGKK